MTSPYQCPYSDCEKVAVHLSDAELEDGKSVTCAACGRRSHLVHVYEPSYSDLGARSWLLMRD